MALSLLFAGQPEASSFSSSQRVAGFEPNPVSQDASLHFAPVGVVVHELGLKDEHGQPFCASIFCTQSAMADMTTLEALKKQELEWLRECRVRDASHRAYMKLRWKPEQTAEPHGWIPDSHQELNVALDYSIVRADEPQGTPRKSEQGHGAAEVEKSHRNGSQRVGDGQRGFEMYHEIYVEHQRSRAPKYCPPTFDKRQGALIATGQNHGGLTHFLNKCEDSACPHEPLYTTTFCGPKKAQYTAQRPRGGQQMTSHQSGTASSWNTLVTSDNEEGYRSSSSTIETDATSLKEAESFYTKLGQEQDVIQNLRVWTGGCEVVA